MDIAAVRTFFMWCSILNVGLLILSSLILTFARGWVYRKHSRWYPIPEESFNVVIYSFIGLFKLFVYVFNIVPFVALAIMG